MSDFAVNLDAVESAPKARKRVHTIVKTDDGVEHVSNTSEQIESVHVIATELEDFFNNFAPGQGGHISVEHGPSITVIPAYRIVSITIEEV